MAIDPASQPLMVELGQQLMRRREALGLSLRAVAARAGTSLNMLTRIEHGTVRNGPRIALLVELSIVLRTPLEDLQQFLIEHVRKSIAP